MSRMNPALEARLRRGFRSFNRFMLLMWRLGLGPWVNIWPAGFGRIMVLTTVGRTSGLPRRTPLNYAVVDGELYCVAGFGGVSDWYRNLRANPHAEVWLPDGWWDALAADISDSPRRPELMRAVLRGSGFVAPLAGVDPRRLDDAALDTATATYRLVHIRRTAARTGPEGPGDLAWVWPAATHIVLFLLLLGRKDRCRRQVRVCALRRPKPL